MENEAMSAAVETAAQTAENAAATQEVVAPAAESAPQAEQQVTEAAAQPASEGAPKARQSKEVNAQHKANRIKAEAYDGISSGILGIARSKGLDPRDAEEAVRMLEADAKGKSYEEYMREQAVAEADLERQVKGSKLYKDLENRAAQDRADAEAYRAAERMRKDLEAIREVDPSVESLESLGDEFQEAVRRMDGLSAYYLIKGMQAANAAAVPPATGAVGNKSDTDRYFTSEELDRLTSKDLDDPNVFQRALRSLQKLK